MAITFALSGGLAGVGGLLFLLQFNIRYDTGFELGLIAFTAVVVLTMLASAAFDPKLIWNRDDR